MNDQAWFMLLKRVVPAPVKRALSPFRILTKLLIERPKGYRNYLLSSISARLRSSRAWGRPVSITIEPANFCNLRCPVCETGGGALGRKPAAMSYEDFVRIMEQVGPGANQLMFYFMGESFLNKDAYRMIRHARDIGLYVLTCTNGEPVDPEKLYESGINRISFQIGGATQETHEIYRQGGNLDREIGNLKRYLEIVRVRGRKPGEHEVELGFIVMKHNEHEVPAFQAMAKELGVDRATVIGPTVRTPEQGDMFLPEAGEHWIFDRPTFEKEHRLVPVRYLPANTCPWIYFAITIQVDGNVVACCRDACGKRVMGNLLEQPLEEIWNGPAFRAFRRAVRANQSQVDLCRLCGGYGFPVMYPRAD